MTVANAAGRKLLDRVPASGQLLVNGLRLTNAGLSVVAGDDSVVLKSEHAKAFAVAAVTIGGVRFVPARH